jgi:DNA-binding transcriptional ArsR family regulator
MAKPVEEVSDERIIKAMGHPLRLRILEALGEEERSPRELSDTLDEPLGNVSYHVRLLLDLGMLRLTRTTQKRGAIEHHYQLVQRPVISDQTWSRMPRAVRDQALGSVLGEIAGDVESAAGHGGFAGDGARLTRLALSLDAAGRAELAAACDELEARAREIEKRGSNGGGSTTRLVLMLFDTSRG